MPLGLGLGLKRGGTFFSIARPDDITPCLCWYDPNNEANGVLATISDRSGNSVNATTTSGSATIVAGASPNGLRKALRWGGGNLAYTRAGVIARPRTICLAYKSNGAGTGRTIGGMSTNYVLGSFSSGNICEFNGSGFTYPQAGAKDIFTIIQSVGTASDTTLFQNTTLLGNSANLGDGGTGLGIGYDGSTPAEWWLGDLFEIIIYSKALNATERSAVNSYLLNKHVN